MAGMFGGNRGFGGSLGSSPLQRLAGGIGMGFGGMQFPQVMTNQLLGGRGGASMFGGGGGGMFGGGMGGGNEPSQAAMMNFANLSELGNRQFAGNQASLDRDQEQSLLQQQLRNALQLQGMRGQNSLDLQGLVNSGALDQIGARGNIEQSLLGRRLSSEENQLAQQLGFNREALAANMGSQGLDRESRERMHGAGLSNALELQSRSDSSAFDRLRAQLTGQSDLQGQEIAGRNALQQLMGGQQMEQLQERARTEAGLQRMRGQQSIGELREQASYARANLMDQLGVQRDLGMGQQNTQRYLGELNAAGQMYDTNSRNELGWGSLANQRYATDAGLAQDQARAQQQAQQFQQSHDLAAMRAADDAMYQQGQLSQRQYEFANPQPQPARPAPSLQDIYGAAWTTAINALPDGSPAELADLVDTYVDQVSSAATGQRPAPGGQRAPRMPSARGLIDEGVATDNYRKMSGSKLTDALAPILQGVPYNPDGTISPDTARELARRGINPQVLDQLNGYDPMLEWGDVGPLSFLPWLVAGEGRQAGERRRDTQSRGRTLRRALMPQ